MHKAHRLFLLVAIVCLLSSAAHAQAGVPNHIAFAGAPQYAQADLLAISGLKPHTSLNADAMNAAARLLADTGFFSNITFSYDGFALTYHLTRACQQFSAGAL
jgi:outer membrane protein assembly factor BamA